MSQSSDMNGALRAAEQALDVLGFASDIGLAFLCRRDLRLGQ